MVCELFFNKTVIFKKRDRRKEGKVGALSSQFLDTCSLVWESVGPERKDVMTLTPLTGALTRLVKKLEKLQQNFVHTC